MECRKEHKSQHSFEWLKLWEADRGNSRIKFLSVLQSFPAISPSFTMDGTKSSINLSLFSWSLICMHDRVIVSVDSTFDRTIALVSRRRLCNGLIIRSMHISGFSILATCKEEHTTVQSALGMNWNPEISVPSLFQWGESTYESRLFCLSNPVKSKRLIHWILHLLYF